MLGWVKTDGDPNADVNRHEHARWAKSWKGPTVSVGCINGWPMWPCGKKCTWNCVWTRQLAKFNHPVAWRCRLRNRYRQWLRSWSSMWPRYSSYIREKSDRANPEKKSGDIKLNFCKTDGKNQTEDTHQANKSARQQWITITFARQDKNLNASQIQSL